MFRFKQFTIAQDRTAMKVCTDACVLGAYANVVGDESRELADRVVRILDIGTGTGLLALMAAQRNPTAIIDAVEIDPSAFGQAIENVSHSPFAGRVRVFHERIQHFYPIEPGHKRPAPDDQERVFYDRVLTNPPFYTNHLRSPDATVNRALHTDELPFADLVTAVMRLMKPTGEWWVLLPPYEAEKLAHLAEPNRLLPFKRLFIRHHAQKPFFRVVTGFAFNKELLPDETLDIYEPDGCTYTDEFRTLLCDFYLIF